MLTIIELRYLVECEYTAELTRTEVPVGCRSDIFKFSCTRFDGGAEIFGAVLCEPCRACDCAGFFYAPVKCPVNEGDHFAHRHIRTDAAADRRVNFRINFAFDACEVPAENGIDFCGCCCEPLRSPLLADFLLDLLALSIGGFGSMRSEGYVRL